MPDLLETLLAQTHGARKETLHRLFYGDGVSSSTSAASSNTIDWIDSPKEFLAYDPGTDTGGVDLVIDEAAFEFVKKQFQRMGSGGQLLDQEQHLRREMAARYAAYMPAATGGLTYSERLMANPIIGPTAEKLLAYHLQTTKKDPKS